MTVYPKKMLPAKRIVSFEDKQTESRVHLPLIYGSANKRD